MARERGIQQMLRDQRGVQRKGMPPALHLPHDAWARGRQRRSRTPQEQHQRRLARKHRKPLLLLLLLIAQALLHQLRVFRERSRVLQHATR
jgi:hypothetical protein